MGKEKFILDKKRKKGSIRMAEPNSLIHYASSKSAKYLNVSICSLTRMPVWQNGYCNSLIHCDPSGSGGSIPSAGVRYSLINIDKLKGKIKGEGR